MSRRWSQGTARHAPPRRHPRETASRARSDRRLPWWPRPASPGRPVGVSILSIQSLVAYGHAGNSAALFPLQRLGKEVWPVMTVHFSNHTGYGDWSGPLLSAARRRRGHRRGRGPGCVRAAARPCSRATRAREDVGAGRARRGGPGQGAQPRRDLLLRPGDGRRRPRHVRAARASPSSCGTGWCRRPTWSPRTTSSSTSWPATTSPPCERAARRRGRRARERAVGRAGHQRGPRRHQRRPRSTWSRSRTRGAWRTRTPRLAHQPPRRRRPDGGGVPGQPARRPRPRPGAGPDHLVGVRGRRGDGRGRRPGAADRAGPGRAWPTRSWSSRPSACAEPGLSSGAACQVRTDDLSLTRRVLYQLS